VLQEQFAIVGTVEPALDDLADLGLVEAGAVDQGGKGWVHYDAPSGLRPSDRASVAILRGWPDRATLAGQAAGVAVQIKCCAPPCGPLARTGFSTTSKPVLRSRAVNFASGFDDHTAKTPPGRSAAR